MAISKKLTSGSVGMTERLPVTEVEPLALPNVFESLSELCLPTPAPAPAPLPALDSDMVEPEMNKNFIRVISHECGTDVPFFDGFSSFFDVLDVSLASAWRRKAYVASSSSVKMVRTFPPVEPDAALLFDGPTVDERPDFFLVTPLGLELEDVRRSPTCRRAEETVVGFSDIDE